MRKLFALLVTLAAIAFGVCSPASAQLTMTGVGGGSPASGGGTPTFTANASPAHQNLSFGSSVATFTAATGTGLVVVCVQAVTGANLTSVKLNTGGGDVTMTLAVAATVTGSRIAEIWYLAGQTANAASTITVTSSAAFSNVSIQTSTLTNVTALPTATATFPFASPASPYSVGPIAIPATGFGVASLYWDTTGNTYTAGVGVTEDFADQTLFTTKLAHMGPGASQTMTYTGTSFQSFVGAFAAWGP